MRNKQVAAVLREIADLTEILGDDPGKAAAYRRAAHALEGLGRDVADLRREGRLREIPGVGPNLARKIEEILDTGTCAHREKLRAALPPGVLELLSVPGVGPRTAGALYRTLGVAGLEDLERAARSGRLETLPGLGTRRAAAILAGLEQVRQRERRFLTALLLPVAEELAALVARLPGVERVAVAGSLRRRRETAGDVNLVAAAEDPGALLAGLRGLPGVLEAAQAGERTLAAALEGGVRAAVLAVPGRSFACALAWFTGSPAHNERLRRRAAERGYRLTETGLYPLAGGDPVFPGSEEELYERLGLAWIPPELREDAGEIEAAEAGRLPSLVTEADIRGDLHLHTTWSDGIDTLREMALAARARGYEYIAVSDHTRSLAVARGLTPERLRQQGEEIAALNRELAPFRILRSAEVDILRDGRLDLPDEVLAELDIVTASVHSAFHLGKEEMTARILAAVRNPHVDIIGHLTGRLIGRRPAYEVDLDAILAAARDTGTALELNASPDRLDVCDRHARLARERGVKVAISTDAHAVSSLADMAMGVATARRGWLEPRDVVNTYPLGDLLAWAGRGG